MRKKCVHTHQTRAVIACTWYKQTTLIATASQIYVNDSLLFCRSGHVIPSAALRFYNLECGATASQTFLQRHTRHGPYRHGKPGRTISLIFWKQRNRIVTREYSKCELGQHQQYRCVKNRPKRTHQLRENQKLPNNTILFETVAKRDVVVRITDDC